MNRHLALLPLLLATAAHARPDDRTDRWWRDVTTLSSDDMEGRGAGTAGHARAATYVEGRLREIGLDPAGTNGGFAQDVAIEEQRIDTAHSTAALTAGGRTTPLVVGTDLIVAGGGAPRAGRIDAPLVFVGYGLHLPTLGHDDLAGVDLRGKIAVAIAGGPTGLPGAAKAASRAERIRYLGERGAVGLILLTPPNQIEIPWERQKALADSPGRYLADPKLRTMTDNFLQASLDPTRGELLFEGAGHSFAEVAALSDAGRPVPGFALPARLTATIATTHRQLSSPNIVAKLPGAGGRLAREYVVLTAHLDHLGLAPTGPDRVYNGTLDNAAGVATLLDIATRLKAGPPMKRSVLIVLVTGEEGGLLGSTRFARSPTVPARSIVADLNFDMALPLFPLRSIIALGGEESTLGAAAQAVGKTMDLPVVPDPLPDRNSFIRSDQYSFVRAGIPALAFKFGFAKGSPEAKIEADWRANRYHSVRDDADQPGIEKADSIRLDDYVAALTRTIADDPDRPRWLATSVFGR